MSLDIVQMRTKLRKPLGVDEDDLPDVDVDLLLNTSYWELLDKFPFREKEVTATFQTTIGTRSYDMPQPFEALRQLSILDPSTNEHTPLKRMTVFEYETKYVEGVDNYAMPCKYTREGCFARLWPTPDDIYTITIKYWTTLADLADGSDPIIPQAWHEIIVFGGIWRGFIDIGDFARANQMKAHQVSLINSMSPVEAKEEIDTHTGGIEVLGREY